MAIEAVMVNLKRALNDIALAAVQDGEAPEGYVLDVDARLWRSTTPTSSG